MTHQVIHIHPDAPRKPAEGQPCNGCGVCCLAEPCPVGMVISRKRVGACTALQWHEAEGRYRCGLLMRPARWPWQRLARAWAARVISAGSGCDASLSAEPTPAEDCPTRDRDETGPP
ncbi:hypothetical protein EYS42_10980 [Aquabacterium lacunae]|uniref:4Fe-4S ferredoxin-type domain-containing protein n=1 Tax=Aquabacterium lacunae TaxID=2528630 RepID=A0A4Q9H3F1_9BURK|nr:hypothetical protein [Aquabacterium lacunae]TBO30214.1 hypothetical protein EYS42_10980 [Aquabacterium lacunae]